MKNTIVLIIPIVILLCCKSKNEKTYLTPNVKKAIENPELGKEYRNLTPKKDDNDPVEEIESKDFRPKGLKPLQITKEDIMGIWKGDYDDGPNATIAIYEDSLLNVEHLERYKYELRNDTLIVDFGDWKSISIVTKAVKDTLILLNENGETVYTTFKD